MIATDILEALWKRKGFIAFCVAIALLICFVYLTAGQTHTVSVYIKYMESEASNGVASNGSKLDPYEITDTYVVGKTLAQLGMPDANVSDFAQRIKVIPVISAAEQQKYASWLEEFSDYEETEADKATPVYFLIEFRTGEGAQFGRDFLNALIHQYRSFYAEEYAGFCEVALVPESVVLNQDYYYSVEMIQSQIEGIQSYLANITAGDTDYRSPLTGYSLDDLIDAYDRLIEMRIAPTMQYILDTGVSKEIQGLTAQLQQSAGDAQLESQEKAVKARTQKELMELYAEKNKEYVSEVIESEDYENQVYGDVERDKAYQRVMTTYDQMILDYVEYAAKSDDLLIDKAYILKHLEKFGNNTGIENAPVEEIQEIYDQYVYLTNITEETLDGYNEFRSGRVILQASGIRAAENVPELLYFTVSFLLAFCLGCGLIVVCELKKWNDEHVQNKAAASERIL